MILIFLVVQLSPADRHCSQTAAAAAAEITVSFLNPPRRDSCHRLPHSIRFRFRRGGIQLRLSSFLFTTAEMPPAASPLASQQQVTATNLALKLYQLHRNTIGLIYLLLKIVKKCTKVQEKQNQQVQIKLKYKCFYKSRK